MQLWAQGDRRASGILALSWLAALLCACSGSSAPPTGASDAPAPPAAATKTYTICPGPDAQKQALIAFFDAHEGDTIHFCAGQFDFTTGLTMTGKRGITIEGEGRDKTILSFKNSPAEDGISINHHTGLVVQNLTIYDAPGNGLRIFRSEYITIRGVKVGWSVADPASPNYDASQKSWTADGSYAFYPVLCHHVLIEDSVSVGSSDAGVYVGQSNDVLVRDTEAFHNVAGFEFENTYRAEFVDNIAHDNVGGFLVFDLPGRAQNGEKNLVHHNQSYHNNLKSFAPRGAIVGDVPSGTGMLVLASDQAEIYDNDIHDNRTAGLFIVNYGLADASEPSTKYDFYPEGIHVYDNTFTDNGGNPELPDLARDTCTGPGGLPGKGDSLTCLGDNPSLLPLILVAKNLGRSAQIVWDGATDVPNDCTTFPVDENGVPLNQPDPQDLDRYEARVDERGRPNFYLYDPNPKCKYNAWKFDAQGQLKKPQNGLCIEHSNKFVNTLQSLLVSDYVNVHFATADPTDPRNLVPVDHDMPQDCPTLAPPYLAQTTPNLGQFAPNPANDPRPSDAQIAAVCGAVQPGQINAAALAGYNCPRLDQYGLFADPAEPRKNPNGFGVPFDLNTILFSDYAVKYRFLFLPPDSDGRPQKARYQDHGDCTTLSIFDCFTATLAFPVGTVIAKTFAFRDGAEEKVIETRLLIKRQKQDGTVYWVGLPYAWTTDASDKPYAALKLEGDTVSVRYDYDDPDPAVVDAQGQRVHYGPGTVSAYQIPNAGACILCHNGDDLEPGSPPIGPKVRNLNKDYTYPDGTTMNQLAYLQSRGMLDLPADPSQLERLPRWNVPGDSGETADSPADIHQRVRAYLEVNCMHCHNPAGNAQNSGLSLDSFVEPMDEGHGICKPPIAAGKAANVGNYDIQPGNSAQSILAARVASSEPGIRMPPVSRTVTHTEAARLIAQWIDQDVEQFANPDDAKCAKSGELLDRGFLPIELMKPVPVPPEDQGKVRTAPWG